jgi:hypothetical protein
MYLSRCSTAVRDLQTKFGGANPEPYCFGFEIRNMQAFPPIAGFSIWAIFA